MAIGQNRWVFRTRTLGHVSLLGWTPGDGAASADAEQVGVAVGVRAVLAGSLSIPRCRAGRCWTRRRWSRRRWRASEINDAYRAVLAGREPEPGPVVLLGPMFNALVSNVGGGGEGIVLPAAEAGSLDRGRTLFLRIDLTPHIPAPLGVTARMVHQHLDSGMNVHAGLCFDFSFNPEHREFVSEQMRRYVGALQAGQAARAKKAA